MTKCERCNKKLNEDQVTDVAGWIVCHGCKADFIAESELVGNMKYDDEKHVFVKSDGEVIEA